MLPRTRLMSPFCSIQHVTLLVAVTVLAYVFVPPFSRTSAPKKSSPTRLDFMVEPSSAVLTDSMRKRHSRWGYIRVDTITFHNRSACKITDQYLPHVPPGKMIKTESPGSSSLIIVSPLTYLASQR